MGIKFLPNGNACCGILSLAYLTALMEEVLNNIDLSVKKLLRAQQSGEACAPIRTLIGDQDLEAAYRVQDLISKMRIDNGARVVGRKIGLTSKAVQKQLGIDQPDFGMLFSDMQRNDGETIPWKQTMQPKVEAEIAFVFNKSLPEKEISMETLLEVIDSAAVAIEIVGSRIHNWDIGITDTIADNASASHFVLGHKRVGLRNLDLVNCKMELNKNGSLVAQGIGADCLGSPLNATLWLVNKIAQLGRPIQKGNVVLSGALGPMAEVAPGDKITAKVEGLGTVNINFGE